MCHATQKTLGAKHKKSVATWSNLCPWWWLFLPSHVRTGQRLARCSSSHPFFFWRAQLTFPSLPFSRSSHVTELQPMACRQKYDMLLPGSACEIVPLCVLHSLPSSKIGCRDSSKGLQDPKGQQSHWMEGRWVLGCHLWHEQEISFYCVTPDIYRWLQQSIWMTNSTEHWHWRHKFWWNVNVTN